MIHAELDGELPDADRAELSRYLLANPEARALRDELRELGRVLDRAESVAPPDGLAESVLAAIGSRFPARSGARFGWSAQPTLLRYAAVFAGGLIVSALAYQFGPRAEPMDTT